MLNRYRTFAKAINQPNAGLIQKTSKLIDQTQAILANIVFVQKKDNTVNVADTKAIEYQNFSLLAYPI